MLIISHAAITILLNVYTIFMYKTITLSINHCQFFSQALLSTVTPKSVPPKISPAGPILAEKLVPPDHFCYQNRSGRTDFGCQNWSPLAKICPPWGTDFGKSSSAKIGSPTKRYDYLCAWMHGCMDIASYCN